MTHKILFICTGNYYRSRYAELFFNKLAAELGIKWKANSRGLEANAGRNTGPISIFALERLTQHGISPGNPVRFPMQLEEKDLQEAGLIIAINRVEHQPMMERLFPAWANRVTYWDIADLNITKAEDALSAIEKKIEKIVTDLVKAHNQ
jgi:protein-tyrosine phosphatase